jgi:putative copper export protein
MKQNLISARVNRVFLALLLCGFQVAAWAQDGGSSSGGSGGSSSTTSSTSSTSTSISDGVSGNWYNSPWVWVIGAAVFILLLVALLGGGRSRSTTTDTTSTTSAGDRVTVQKTVRRDDVDDV